MIDDALMMPPQPTTPLCAVSIWSTTTSDIIRVVYTLKRVECVHLGDRDHIRPMDCACERNESATAAILKPTKIIFFPLVLSAV